MDQNENLLKLRQGVDALYTAIEAVANTPLPTLEPANNSISGDKIHGGRITKFKSTGIEDASTRAVVLVNDLGVHTDSLTVKTLQGDVAVIGDLNVKGEITATKLHVNELSADVRNERTSSLEFLADDNGIYGKGLVWKGNGSTKQLVYRANPDRLWTSESIDLGPNAAYMINNVPVISGNELGSSIRTSNLTSVGTLKNLRTQGNLVVDDFIFYDADSQRLGFGTEAANATISIVSYESEFIIDVDNAATRIGTWTTDGLEIVTDNTTRLTVNANGHIHFGTKGNDSARVSVFGKLGVGVNNVSETVSLSVAGPIEFQGKKIEVGNGIPESGVYRQGDIVYNSSPVATSYIGWVCVREGTPGVWKPFGQISA